MNDRLSRRTALAGLGVLVLTPLLAACAGSAPSASAPAAAAPASAPAATTAPASANATAAPAASASQAGPATTKLRYLYNATPGVDEQVHLDLIKLYNKMYPNVQVEKIRVPNDAEIVRKLLAMLAAHDPPDLFWNRQRTAPPFIDRGVLLDVTPFMATDKIDAKDFWPSALETYGREGKLYGLPNSASSNVHYFNADLFKAAGVPLPTEIAKQGSWDWNALVDTATKLTKGSGPTKQYGFDQITDIYAVDMYIWQNGGTLWSADLKQCHLDQPADVGGLQWLVDNVVTRKITPSSLDLQAQGSNLFGGGRIAMKMAGRYELPSLAKAKFTVGMVVSPKGPKADTTRGDDLASSIVKAAPNRENAWTFAKMWSSDAGQVITLASQRSFTSRRSFSTSDAMKKNLLAWEVLDDYINGLERTKAYRAPAQTGQVNSIFDQQLDLAYSGEKTAKDVATAMTQQINPVLLKPL